MEFIDLSWFGVWYFICYIAPTNKWLSEAAWHMVSLGVSVDEDVLKEAWREVVELIEEARAIYHKNEETRDVHLYALYERIYPLVLKLDKDKRDEALTLLQFDNQSSRA